MDSGGNDAVDFSTAPARVISPESPSPVPQRSTQQVWPEASVLPTKTLSLDCVQKVLRPPGCPDSGRATCCPVYTAGADSRPECRAAVGGQNVNLRGLSVRPTGKDTARGHTPDWEGHSKRTHTRLGRTQQEDTPRLGRTHPDWEGHTPTGKDTARGHTPTGKDTPRLERTHSDWEGHTPTGKETPRLGRTQQEDTPRLGRTQQEDTPRLGRTQKEDRHPTAKDTARGHTPDWEGHTPTGKDNTPRDHCCFGDPDGELGQPDPA